MGLKWPFWAILDVLGAFSGNLGLLDVILDQYAAAGTSHAHNCASYVEILAFLASFRAILTVFWADFGPWGPFGPFLGPLGAFWALFSPFWGLLGPF